MPFSTRSGAVIRRTPIWRATGVAGPLKRKASAKAGLSRPGSRRGNTPPASVTPPVAMKVMAISPAKRAMSCQNMRTLAAASLAGLRAAVALKASGVIGSGGSSLACKRIIAAARLDQRANAKAGARPENQLWPAGDGVGRDDDLAIGVGNHWQRQRQSLKIVEEQALRQAQPLGDLRAVNQPRRIGKLQFATDDRPGAASHKGANAFGQITGCQNRRIQIGMGLGLQEYRCT